MYNKKYNELTIIGKTPEYVKDSKKYWKAKCSCGRECIVSEGDLLNNRKTTCSNCNGIQDFKIGQIIGNLKILSDFYKKGKKIHYICSCNCGNPKKMSIAGSYLLRSDIKIKSCGECYKFEYIGKKIGNLTFLEYIEVDGKPKNTKYLCKCDCGKQTIMKRSRINEKNTAFHCGCQTYINRSKIKTHDITGKKFGSVTVIKRVGARNGESRYKCLCAICGKYKEMSRACVLRNKKSCGCIKPKLPKNAAELKMRKNDKKYIGKKIGMLTPIKRVKTEGGYHAYECLCECGGKRVVPISKITARKINDCGCQLRNMYMNKLKKKFIGKKYGKITIKDIFIRKGSYQKTMAIGSCECGSDEKEYELGSLKNFHTKSCGCIRKSMTGENHPNWNPELTDEQRKENECRTGNPLYQRWRKKVLKRDKKCQACGEKEDLRSHHIVPWCVSEEKRFNVDNGITLCEECHKLFHSIYGQTPNAPEDLKEFIELI